MISIFPQLSLYVHIPFCSLKCTYCAFNTYTNLDHLIPAFVDALCKEVSLVGRSRPGQTVHSVFFGGGTPTLLTVEQFEQILATIKAHFSLLPDAEITAEANPNDLSLEYAQGLRQIGITRMSIGMQSSNVGELKLFARQHDYARVVQAVDVVRKVGFENYNLDVIYGVPQQTLATWETTLRDTLILQPTHISLYALGLEDGTPLKGWVESGRVPAPDDDLAADMYELATDLLEQEGFEQYEISNWARPGYACKHNLQYWYNYDYLGFGPGAHGFAGGVRYAVMLKPADYIRAVESGSGSLEYPRSPALEWANVVERDDEIAETLIMTLRLTREGVDREVFRERFGIDLVDLHRGPITKFTQHGLLEVTDTVVRLTKKGRLLSNLIFRELV